MAKREKQNKWNDPFYAEKRMSFLKGIKRTIAFANYSLMKIGQKSNPIKGAK